MCTKALKKEETFKELKAIGWRQRMGKRETVHGAIEADGARKM